MDSGLETGFGTKNLILVAVFGLAIAVTGNLLDNIKKQKTITMEKFKHCRLKFVSKEKKGRV